MFVFQDFYFSGSANLDLNRKRRIFALTGINDVWKFLPKEQQNEINSNPLVVPEDFDRLQDSLKTAFRNKSMFEKQGIALGKEAGLEYANIGARIEAVKMFGGKITSDFEKTVSCQEMAGNVLRAFVDLEFVVQKANELKRQERGDGNGMKNIAPIAANAENGSRHAWKSVGRAGLFEEIDMRIGGMGEKNRRNVKKTIEKTHGILAAKFGAEIADMEALKLAQLAPLIENIGGINFDAVYAARAQGRLDFHGELADMRGIADNGAYKMKEGRDGVFAALEMVYPGQYRKLEGKVNGKMRYGYASIIKPLDKRKPKMLKKGERKTAEPASGTSGLGFAPKEAGKQGAYDGSAQEQEFRAEQAKYAPQIGKLIVKTAEMVREFHPDKEEGKRQFVNLCGGMPMSAQVADLMSNMILNDIQRGQDSSNYTQMSDEMSENIQQKIIEFEEALHEGRPDIGEKAEAIIEWFFGNYRGSANSRGNEFAWETPLN